MIDTSLKGNLEAGKKMVLRLGMLIGAIWLVAVFLPIIMIALR